jgi:hypothetical protein
VTVRRRFLHERRVTEWRMISDEGGVTVRYGELPHPKVRSGDLFTGGTKNETPAGTFDEEVEKAHARGFTIEVDELGQPVDEAATIRQVLTRYLDPRSKFEALRKLLTSSKSPGSVLALLLPLVAEIEADMDEHDTAFAPEDDGPDLGAPRAYRAHYEQLLKDLAGGRALTRAELSFRYAPK